MDAGRPAGYLAAAVDLESIRCPGAEDPATGGLERQFGVGYRPGDGEGQVDLNYDGVIELNELAHYTDLELAFLEGQKSMFYSAKSFPAAATLALVEDEAVPRVGQRLEVESKGKWYKAQIIDVDGDQVEVHFAGFDDSWNEWVSRDCIRPKP